MMSFDNKEYFVSGTEEYYLRNKIEQYERNYFDYDYLGVKQGRKASIRRIYEKI